MSNNKPLKTNTCPEGGRHQFLMGTCFKCGISIRVWNTDKKAKMKIYQAKYEKERRK
ncbi:MAG TPA: hypothetical protein VG347_05080 [Verrucomicrobiae bacterium]|nr:hypothetical protein [Verrucomicrobiae bacterium]